MSDQFTHRYKNIVSRPDRTDKEIEDSAFLKLSVEEQRELLEKGVDALNEVCPIHRDKALGGVVILVTDNGVLIRAAGTIGDYIQALDAFRGMVQERVNDAAEEYLRNKKFGPSQN